MPLSALPAHLVVNGVAIVSMARVGYILCAESRRLVNKAWARFAGPQAAVAGNVAAHNPAGVGAVGAQPTTGDPIPRQPLPLRTMAAQVAACAASAVEPAALGRSMSHLPVGVRDDVLAAHAPERAAYKQAHPYQWRMDYLAGLFRRT